MCVCTCVDVCVLTFAIYTSALEQFQSAMFARVSLYASVFFSVCVCVCLHPSLYTNACLCQFFREHLSRSMNVTMSVHVGSVHVNRRVHVIVPAQ